MDGSLPYIPDAHPQNDQAAALYSDQLDILLEQVRRFRAAAASQGEGNDEATLTAACFWALSTQNNWPVDRYISLLAAALIRMTHVD